MHAVDGSVIWDFDTYVDTPPIPATSGWGCTIHPIADLNGDAISDVIFGCGSFNDGAYAVDGRLGSVIYRLEANDVIYSSGVLSSIDLDPRPEAVFGGGDGTSPSTASAERARGRRRSPGASTTAAPTGTCRRSRT